MFLNVDSPIFQAAIAPFAVSCVLVGAIVVFVRGDRRSSMAVCFAAIALLVAYWLAFSWPPFPPRAATQKVGYLIGLSAVLSLALAARPRLYRLASTAVFLVVIAGLVWIAQSKIAQGQILNVAVVVLIGVVAAFGLSVRRGEPVDNGVAVLVGAIVIAGIAFAAPSASLALIGGAIAAATGGFLVWTWPKRRLDFAEPGLLAVAVPLILLAGQASLYSGANNIAILVAAAIAFAPSIRAATLRGPSMDTDLLRPIATGVVAAIVGAVALAIAFMNQTGSSGYG